MTCGKDYKSDLANNYGGKTEYDYGNSQLTRVECLNSPMSNVTDIINIMHA